MSVKAHYDNHLGFFYSWMVGNTTSKINEFVEFIKKHQLLPKSTGIAIDLGAGHGIQSLALAQSGFKVTAIDFNQTLLDELKAADQGDTIEILNGDLRKVLSYKNKQPELIVCCGDTIAHLDSKEEIESLIIDISNTLTPNGKLILSFRDYRTPLTDNSRFIPVKQSESRMLTCFLEYEDQQVKVTDILHEKENGKWIQKVSSYNKVRVSEPMILDLLESNGFKVQLSETTKGIIKIIAINIS